MSYTYVGEELDLFEKAVNWKSYLRAAISPFLGSSVLEVGAGHGGTTRMLHPATPLHWLALEPDPTLAGRLSGSVASGEIPSSVRVVVGTLETLDPSERDFDSVLYIDVLEHIDDDRGEAVRAIERLAPGGRLVVLAPAHQWLYSPFDTALGHFRRYSRKSLRAVSPPGADLIELKYLDSFGLLASLGNRLGLKQSMPTPGQIALWDGYLVPLSRRLDFLSFGRVGKSVLGVWRKR